jgi:hypothetical protein
VQPDARRCGEFGGVRIVGREHADVDRLDSRRASSRARRRGRERRRSLPELGEPDRAPHRISTAPGCGCPPRPYCKTRARLDAWAQGRSPCRRRGPRPGPPRSRPRVRPASATIGACASSCSTSRPRASSAGGSSRRPAPGGPLAARRSSFAKGSLGSGLEGPAPARKSSPSSPRLDRALRFIFPALVRRALLVARQGGGFPVSTPRHVRSVDDAAALSLPWCQQSGQST